MQFSKKYYLALILIFHVSTTSAAEYYVNPTGLDTRTATQAQNPATPWQTIQKAASTVLAGSTVHVAPGVYTPSAGSTTGVATINNIGTESSRIVFVSDTKWGAKIQGSSSEALIRINGKFVDFQGFDISGSGSVQEGILVTQSNVRIIGNKIHDINGSGAKTWNASYNPQNIDFLNNLIYNIGSGNLYHGIYVMGQGGRVSNNIIHHVTGFGIHAWHAASNYIFSNNLVWSSGESGITVGNGDEPGGTIADNFVVTNNILINNGKYGFSENGFTGIHNIYKNNLTYSNGLGNYSLQNGNVALNNLNVAPGFVNFQLDGTGNYHLSLTSPALNMGTSEGAPESDFEGAIHQCNKPDIGPY